MAAESKPQGLEMRAHPTFLVRLEREPTDEERVLSSQQVRALEVEVF